MVLLERRSPSRSQTRSSHPRQHDQLAIEPGAGGVRQTSLSQLEDVEVSVDVLDAPTFIGKVRAGEYVSIGTFFGSGLSTSYSKYSNAEVDALIKSSSVTDDLDGRVELYGQVFEMVAEDVGVVPFCTARSGGCSPTRCTTVELYEDGIPR